MQRLPVWAGLIRTLRLVSTAKWDVRTVHRAVHAALDIRQSEVSTISNVYHLNTLSCVRGLSRALR